jgi:tRNA (cytidine/uridine-2'-O-)-methyltransferase
VDTAIVDHSENRTDKIVFYRVLDIIFGVTFFCMGIFGGMLNVVLINPEIPQNTGNVARSVISHNSTLHLVKPLGFSIDDRNLKRAGLDYWQFVDLKIWDDEETFFGQTDIKKVHLFSTKGELRYDKAVYEDGDYLVFGSESTGLSHDLLRKFPGRTRYLPMSDLKVRSLNLSSAVAASFFEALRQLDFYGEGSSDV